MPENNTTQPVSNEERGYQPLREGYQPANTLKSDPPQGGSGVPNAAPAKPTSSAAQSSN
jgi:hypothetical protein